MDMLSLFKSFAPKEVNTVGTGVNAVIYTRVSHHSQEENTSLESQRKYCENFAARRGLNIVGYFGGTYESAKTDDRKEFNRMLNFVKRSKNITYVIVYSYERFSRSGINGAQIADDLLKKYGVITLAVTQELDPTTPSGSFQQKILFLFSQMDNEMRREKSMAGMKEMLLKGYWIWEAPRGYIDLNKGGRANERQLVVSDEGKLLRKAFEWKAYKKMSNADITRKLKKMGMKIDERRLNNLFSNPFYCGAITSKMIPDQVIKGHHEPMVPVDLFLTVNGIREENRSQGYTKVPNNENLPLKVFTKCDHCQGTITGYLAKRKGLYYYKCRTRGCKNNRSAKAMHSLFKGMLESFVIAKEELEIIKISLEEQFENFFEQQLNQKKLLKKSLQETLSKIEKIEERYVVGEIDKDIYEKFKKKFQKEQDEIQKELSNTTLNSSNLSKVIDFATNICSNLLKMWEKGDLHTKRAFQEMLFPEGIIYNRKHDRVRTPRINTFFSPIPELARLLKGNKKGDSTFLSEIPHVGWKIGFTSTSLRFAQHKLLTRSIKV
jgi:DNA invertase Pin-like site-specific DNA recombinase